MARHRGSLLGDLPDDPQPTQKAFDSELVVGARALRSGASRLRRIGEPKIGTVQLPDALLAAMRAAECIRVVLPRPLRIELLKDEYAHFLADPDALSARLERLVPLHGKKTIERWIDAAKAGDWDELVGELLELHYDPMYPRSIGGTFRASQDAIDVAPVGADRQRLPGARARARRAGPRARHRLKEHR